MPDYRVNLEMYNGPLDLLLYLIRRDELDIHDIPISRITEQYLQYVGMIEQLDPNLAGEFLVLAATLMEIKSRMLLPSPPPEEGARGRAWRSTSRNGAATAGIQGLQGRRGRPGGCRRRPAMKFGRRPFVPDHDPTELDLDDVQVWDLMDAFSRLMTSIGSRPGSHHRHLRRHAGGAARHRYPRPIAERGWNAFAKIFEGRISRSEIVGLFVGGCWNWCGRRRCSRPGPDLRRDSNRASIPTRRRPAPRPRPRLILIIAGDQRQVDAAGGQSSRRGRRCGRTGSGRAR